MKECFNCQQPKVLKSSKPELGKLNINSARFVYIYIYTIGQLSESADKNYCLTVIDKATPVFPKV